MIYIFLEFIESKDLFKTINSCEKVFSPPLQTTNKQANRKGRRTRTSRKGNYQRDRGSAAGLNDLCRVVFIQSQSTEYYPQSPAGHQGGFGQWETSLCVCFFFFFNLRSGLNLQLFHEVIVCLSVESWTLTETSEACSSWGVGLHSCVTSCSRARHFGWPVTSGKFVSLHLSLFLRLTYLMGWTGLWIRRHFSTSTLCLWLLMPLTTTQTQDTSVTVLLCTIVCTACVFTLMDTCIKRNDVFPR